MQATQAAAGDTATLEAATYRKVGWRLIPLLMLCYFVAYLDRVNVGFAQLQMKSDLQFSDAVYGFGAGIFFLGYFLFEVPSNLVLHRVGARIWIARIMITWGLISALTMFIQTPTMFYVALPAGPGRSGILPRHHPLPHLLVPGGPAQPDDGLVHVGRGALGLDRRAGVGLDPAHLPRSRRPGRLAVAVPARRPAGGGSRRGGAALSG
jgi:hypothetical protein